MTESPLKGKVVLVVEDETELRHALMFEFKRRGCTIYEAGDGVQGLEMVKTHDIDIIVSDVRMPRSSGVELLKNVRISNPDLPIVLLATGFADLSEPEALSMGAYGLIEKPINRKRMISLLENYCRSLEKAAAGSSH
jgi:DNA-binding NtrC family response regulator